MDRSLKIEELFLFGLSIFLFSQLDFAWWLFPVFLLLPDVSMAGYVRDPIIGANIYNFFHHRALSIGLYLFGILIGSSVWQLIGVILMGHSSLDRVLGFGLKFPTSFQHTHLGKIGRT